MHHLQPESRWWRALRQDVWPLIIPCLLLSPMLFMGFALDDYFHRAVMDGSIRSFFGDVNPVSELFAFLPADEDAQAVMRETGLTWWSAEGVRANFIGH